LIALRSTENCWVFPVEGRITGAQGLAGQTSAIPWSLLRVSKPLSVTKHPFVGSPPKQHGWGEKQGSHFATALDI